MNAAARALEQSRYFRTFQFTVTKDLVMTLLLGLLVFTVAFVVVYLKDWERSYYSDLEGAKQQSHFLHIEWGQLLLEQSTWAAPTRIQRIAQNNARMHSPSEDQIVVINI